MKVKRLFLFTIFCILLLTACSKDLAKSPQSKDTQEASSGKSTITITPSEDYVYPAIDYSDHTNSRETLYITKLADPSKLIAGKPVIALLEQTADWSDLKLQGLDKKDDIFGYDVRSQDISGEDLSVVEDFNDLSFNTDTIWPKKLPKGFKPDQILEYNKNPGLGIRKLHEQGITGAGVGIAIIDQGLLLSHEQYKNNIMFYEKLHCIDSCAALHGPAVASIAVGKDIGVAPASKLYYIASTFGHFTDKGYDFDASIIADAILRILEINKNLPENEKIRVISISKGYHSNDQGYEEVTAAIKKADEQNIFVITTSTAEYYKNFKLMGVDRDYTDDPDRFNSFQPAAWVEEDFYANPRIKSNLTLVPIGARTIAGCTGDDAYSIGRNGGLSWGVPWCAGFYALCCQVKPDLTPQEFIEAVNSTSVTTDIEHDGKTYQLGNIINPAAAIEELKD